MTRSITRRWKRSSISGRGAVLPCGLAPALAAIVACGHADARALRAQSRRVGRAVERGDYDNLKQAVTPGAYSRVDHAALARDREGWAAGLRKPQLVQPEAIVFLAHDLPVDVVWTPEGWRFAEDPTDLYAQDTPRQALRALVRASELKRWDVLIGLAPRRYRTGLSEEDLERAWTQGDQARELRAARDRLRNHLAEPIVKDSHEAVLDMGDGNVARLEREGRRWVVVDF